MLNINHVLNMRKDNVHIVVLSDLMYSLQE